MARTVPTKTEQENMSPEELNAKREQYYKDNYGMSTAEYGSYREAGPLPAAPNIGTPPSAPTVNPGVVAAVSDTPTAPEYTVPESPTITEAPSAPNVNVTPAPSYEPSPEEQAWKETYGEELADWVAAGGYGIPEETQETMMEQQFQILKSREQESIKNMRNNMERRGITNSGFVYANEQKIRAATSTELAQSASNIQIQSAFMKMASFETAMGHAANFLGYLQQESQLRYAPKLATWQAEQEASLMKVQMQHQSDIQQWQMENNLAIEQWNKETQAQWMQIEQQFQADMMKWEQTEMQKIEKWKMDMQAQMFNAEMQQQVNLAVFQAKSQLKMQVYQNQVDMYKFNLNQKYTQDNMRFQNYLDTKFENEVLQPNRIQIAEMELEAQNQAGLMGAFGTTLGIIF